MRSGSVLLGVVVFLAGCTGDNVEDRSEDPGPTQPWFAFGPALNITPATDGYGSEPSILAARDGSVYVVSVLGSAEARGDALWKTNDLGQSWTYLGKPDYPFGGGDADIDEDEAGTLYLPGQWRPVAPPPNDVANPYITGGESMAVSKDGGATWVTNPVASDMPVTDRQWTGTYGAGTAWLAFNQAQQGLVVTKSTNSGLTWSPARIMPGTWDPGDGVTGGGPNGIPGDLVVDGRDGTLYIPYGPGIGGGSSQHRIFVSHDGGTSYSQIILHEAAPGEQAGAIFSSLEMDDEGGLYYVWSESVEGGSGGMRVFFTTSRDAGRSWTPRISVTPPGMTAVFPWIAAGSPDHVAVAFYGAPGRFLADEAPGNQSWFPFIALSKDADGPNATFDIVPLSLTPNHVGPLCTGGTSCDSQYRRLGDFFEIDITREGRVVAVWVDDTVSPRVNVFAAQSEGSLRPG